MLNKVLSNETVEEILTFWFGDSKGELIPAEQYINRWWIKDPQTDSMIKVMFEYALEDAKKLDLELRDITARQSLALIILLDQFSRNIYRDKKESFAQDGICLKIALSGIEKGLDIELAPIQRLFYYMPLMHSEDIKIQQLSVTYYKKLENEYSDDPALNDKLCNSREYAEMHSRIIERFGRYPHRNYILGRKSTDEEKEFLSQPGSSF